MKIAIFSDLHLSRHRRKDHEALFVKTLTSLRQSQCSELWLLGDIFDVMLGPFEFWKDLHPKFFEEIQLWIQEGRSVLWIQGNHDFYLEALLEPMGIEVSDSHVIKQIQGRSIYLAHGDLINSEDRIYLKWRAFTRSQSFRNFLSFLPERVRRFLIPELAKRVSDKSRQNSQIAHSYPRTGEIFRTFAQDLWKQSVAGVCLGHSHQEEYLRNSDGTFYLNLGSWINYSPRYALWDTLSDNYPQVIKI
jgi:UDP-2,3-diacylglucosamine hydrolase